MRPRLAPSADAHRDLARPVRRACEQQVGDVRAGDQQHEADRAQQRQEDRPDRPAVEALVERHQSRRRCSCWSRDTSLQLSRDGQHLGIGLGPRDARCQPAEHIVSPVAHDVACHRQERPPQVGVGREPHAFRHHADDRVGDLVDLERAADDAGVAAVAVLPDAVADQDHRRCAGGVLAGAKSRPEKRLLAEQPEAYWP